MIVTYSLWGDSDAYNYGALENALTVRDFYPHAQCWMYVHRPSCQEKVILALEQLDHVRVIDMSVIEPGIGMKNSMWRFLPVFQSVDDQPRHHEAKSDEQVVLVRDADSRFTRRERLAVEEWLRSDKDFHIMRDHSWHNDVMLAGMWGARRRAGHKFKACFDAYPRANSRRGIDQAFLKKHVYPILQTEAFIHSRYHKYEAQCVDFAAFEGDERSETHHIGLIEYTAPKALACLGDPCAQRSLERTQRHHE